jgi:hypothetical protein
MGLAKTIDFRATKVGNEGEDSTGYQAYECVWLMLRYKVTSGKEALDSGLVTISPVCTFSSEEVIGFLDQEVERYQSGGWK